MSADSSVRDTRGFFPEEQIAYVCHSANKAWCDLHGDFSQKRWEDAEEWQRQSAIAGVKFRLENPGASPKMQHEAWRQAKAADGWVYGEEKDAEKKTHPCMVPYAELPEFQRRKDALFAAICNALTGEI
jgi:hypothetical protein